VSRKEEGGSYVRSPSDWIGYPKAQSQLDNSIAGFVQGTAVYQHTAERWIMEG